jgi:uncharacterized protein (DUF2141 family)
MFKAGLFFVLLNFSAMGQEKAGPAASLELIIQQNKEISKGYFLINLFSSKDGFPEKYTKAFRSIKIKPTGIKTIYQFDNLPAGNYAVAILADINDNGKMDMNLLGMPKEAFGFSNNVIGLFGPPSFEKAQIVVQENKRSSVSIELRN